MAHAKTVVNFPVKQRRKDRPVLASIVDLRGQMARILEQQGDVPAQRRQREIGVSLPPLSFYGGKPCRYLNGCLYIGDEIVRRRKI
jgi:hypothetical protein